MRPLPTWLDNARARIAPVWFKSWWAEVRDNLWLYPALCTVLSVVLALIMVRVDTLSGADGAILRSPFLFGGGADGARGVLTAIAGSIVTVTGTIFSVVIVALQLASGQFTPRVMRQFTGDRINQFVLALMIGTFTYCLLVLRTVRTVDDQRGAFVPAFSVSLAIVLALCCISGLILFIHHSARQLQVSHILQRVGEDTRRLIEATFSIDEPVGAAQRPLSSPAGTPVAVLSSSSGYLQTIDFDRLCDIAGTRHVTIRLHHTVGTHVLIGMTLASAWRDDEPVSEDDVREIRHNMVVGVERTLDHDVAFGIRQVADIAVKALSPAINDPTTAVQAIDLLEDLLVCAGRRYPQPVAIELDGRVAILRESVSFSSLVDVAFTQIRHYGAADVVVMAHLIAGLRAVAELVLPQNRVVVVEHGRLALEVALASVELEDERIALRHAGRWMSDND